MVYKIVADSSSDIPSELSTKLGIVTVPMPVYIDGKTYYEGVDIFTDRFYADFKEYGDLPKTSQPNPKALQETYEKILAEGFDVIAIHLSSGLSSTYQTAVMIKEMCSSPERIHIIDSLGASLGFGLQAILASEIAHRYEEWSQIEQELIAIRDNMRYIFTIDTLEYLVKGGRVSKTAGFIAGLLDVKPVLHFTAEGKIDVFAKVRSRKAAVRKLMEIMEQDMSDPENQIIGISHAASPEDAALLKKEIQRRFNVKQIVMGEIGCVIGSHVGPGALALFYTAKQE